MEHVYSLGLKTFKPGQSTNNRERRALAQQYQSLRVLAKLGLGVPSHSFKAWVALPIKPV
jgi:hypothetical protein